MLDMVNEGSTAYLGVEFLDKNNDPDEPNTISYRIDCLSSGTEIRADTSVTPAESVEIKLTPTDHVIVNPAKPHEKRLVTITASYGPEDELNEEYEYNVKNLRKKPDAT